ncbi:hypothetical protein [Myxosarcina sp. GI1]|uniref:hypothetical protein n=1 Tax=Myxosarcina sp. GI1 TaxID=1541065 RepID=UPI000569D729|nr:hypothetical protein [Myxosarcina sp. GI1]
MPARRITLEINLEGGSRTAGEVRAIADRFERLQEQMRQVEEVASALNANIDDVDTLINALGISAEQAREAIAGLRQEQQGLREVGSTLRELDLTETQNNVLASILGNPDDIGRYIQALNGLSESLDDVFEVARLTGSNVAEAEEYIEQLGLTAQETAAALRRVRAGETVGADRDTQRRNLQQGGLDVEDRQLDLLLDRGNRGLEQANRGAADLFRNLSGLAFGFNQLLFAVQTFATAGGDAFNDLILANERLRADVLNTQSTLSATLNVYRGEELIEDPTEAILALEGPVREAIERVRKDTLDLVGVTSSEVLEIFGILNTAATEITNQSAEFPNNIDAAVKLTKSFTSALGVAQIPIAAAKQEIISILSAQKDNNSILATRLGLSNEQLRAWKAQGVLVDELQKKLTPFVIANQMNARSIEGITSNLRDIYEIVARESAEELYSGIVDQLQRLYDFVQNNQEAIANNVDEAVEFLRQLLTTILEGLEGIIQKLTPTIATLGETLKMAAAEGGEILLRVVEDLFQITNEFLVLLQPLLNLLNQTLQVLNDTGLTEIVVQVGALSAALALLGPLLNKGVLVPLANLSTTITAKFIPALTTGTLSLGTMKASLVAFAATAKASLTTFAATLAPVLPAIAALGVGIAGVQSIKLKLGNDAIDAYAKSVKTAGDESFNYAVKLKELNDLEAENGKLTEEQRKQKENLVDISQQLIEQNEKQIAELKQAATQNKSQANSYNALIQQLEISNNALAKQAGLLDENSDAVTTQGKALKNLGPAYDQIRRRIESNLDVVRRGRGETEEVSNQAKQAVSDIQQLVEAGAISIADALVQLREINDAFLNDEARLAAQKAIFSALEAQIERTNQVLKQAETERLIDLQKLLNQQLITEGEYNKRRSQLTTERIKQELTAEKERLNQIELLYDLTEEEKQEERRKAIARTTELQLELLQQERAEREAIVALVRDQQERQLGAVRRETNLRVSAQREEKEAIAETNRELERQITAQEVIIRNLETQTRLINSYAEVEAARRNLVEVENDVETQRITRILELRKLINSGELKTREERKEALLELQRLDGLNRRATIDYQRRLEQLEEERFKRRIEAQQAEQELARKLLAIEIQRNQTAAERSYLEARMELGRARQAEVDARSTAQQAYQPIREAEAALEVARAAGDKEAIANAEADLKLAQQDYQIAVDNIKLSLEAISLARESVTESKRQLDLQEQFADNQKEVLNLQQQASDVQLEQEARAKGMADELERSVKAALRLSSALKSVPIAAQLAGGTGIVELQQRFKGGEMLAGQPYLVGEDRQGNFIPGVSEIVVPNINSYAIAADKAREIFEAGQQQRITNNSYISAPILNSNRQLLDAINGLRQDIKNSKPGTVNKIEGIQFVNNLTRADNKAEAMRFARDLADTLEQTLRENF